MIRTDFAEEVPGALAFAGQSEQSEGHAAAPQLVGDLTAVLDMVQAGDRGDVGQFELLDEAEEEYGALALRQVGDGLPHQRELLELSQKTLLGFGNLLKMFSRQLLILAMKS